QRSHDQQLLEKIDSKEMFTYNEDSAFLYIHMELCQSTLAHWLTHNDERDLNQIKDWFVQISDAVAYIHEKKYIHRDLKPSNDLLFASEDHLKVCDLGIVTDRVISNDEPGEEVGQERTFAKGTAKYMAPEQMGWADYTSKVDIFALGLILAEMCVVMPAVEAEEESFITLLTNPNDTERPEARKISAHPFTYSERRKKELEWYKKYRTNRARNLAKSYNYSRKMKQLESQLETAREQLHAKKTDEQDDSSA
ncbi:hypothetical protein PMAYCL1PPCAC_08149, partial [Pristionchus mayeri]